MSDLICSKCRRPLEEDEAYEYRGAISCAGCFDEVEADRNKERAEIIQEESGKTECFKGLDLSDSAVGVANRSILKTRIEIAQKESFRLKKYEGRK